MCITRNYWQREKRKYDFDRQTIILDIDGTIVDFNKYIWKIAIPYFTVKFDFKIVNKNGLEIEDIIDFPEEKEKELLNKFWIGPSYLKYIFGNYAKGNVKTCIRELEKQGFHIEIHTSRGISSSNAMVSFVNRLLARIQLFGLGLSRYKVFFYRSDDEKVDDIIKRGA